MRHSSYLFLVLVFTWAMPAAATDIDTLIATECEGCHGPAGVSGNPDIPSIGGQSADYILVSLGAYQEWGRPCVKSAYRYGDTTRPVSNMCKVTENLTEEDFKALSAHFSALPWVPARQEFDPAGAAVGAELHETLCENCHTGGGSGPGIGPKLAGQWTVYLREGLKYVPTGEHLVPPLMENKIIELSDDELDALMNFYASQQAAD